MIRVAKDPEIRRTELIDVAEKLFLKNGYDETAVSDIVKEAKVAQGTFYYYFRSKDEVLNAILDRYVAEIKGVLDTITADEKLRTIEKFMYAIKVFQEFRKQHQDMERLVDIVHEEKNEILHYRVEKKNSPIFVEFYEKLIEQGISEGIFETSYPHETAVALLASSSALGHDARRNGSSIDEVLTTVFATMEIWERLLGAKKGTFSEIMEYAEKEFGKLQKTMGNDKKKDVTE